MTALRLRRYGLAGLLLLLALGLLGLVQDVSGAPLTPARRGMTTLPEVAAGSPTICDPAAEEEAGSGPCLGPPVRLRPEKLFLAGDPAPPRRRPVPYRNPHAATAHALPRPPPAS